MRMRDECKIINMHRKVKHLWNKYHGLFVNSRVPVWSSSRVVPRTMVHCSHVILTLLKAYIRPHLSHAQKRHLDRLNNALNMFATPCQAVYVFVSLAMTTFANVFVF